jgi:DNA polymerase-3 subunit delta
MIYLLHGPDDYSIRESVRKLLRAALPEDTAAMNTTRLAAGEVTLDALRFACEAMPFLADRRAVIVEQLFSTSKQAQVAKDVAAYLPSAPENALLVFVESAAPPKSGPIAKALAEAQVKQQSFPTLAGAPLQRWIKARAKDEGTTITDPAAGVLADFAGGDLRTLSNELKKLATYAGPGRSIDAPDVQLLVHQTHEANVFELVDALAQGQRSRALLALHVLFEQGERPERILGMVARQVRLLLQAKDALGQGQSPDAVGRLVGLPPFPTRKLLDQVRRFTLAQLFAMHRRVLETDLQTKTGQQEPALALELLVADLAGQARRAAPVRRGG